MFCTNCGAQNEDGAMFCTGCGAPLRAPEGEAGTPAPEPVAPAPEPAPMPMPEPVAPEPDQAAPAAQQPPQEWPGQTAQQPPVDWPQQAPAADQATQQPPQEWPSQPGQPEGKKKSKTGLIVGIVVGVLVVAAIAVGALFATGVISLPGGDEPAAEESAEAEPRDEGDPGDEGASDRDEDKDEDEGKGKSDREADADLGLASSDLYDQEPADLQASLEDMGIELAHTSAFRSDYASDALYVTFSGSVDAKLPHMSGSDVEVTVYIDLTGDEDFDYDDSGYADEPVSDLADLPDGCEVTDFEVDYQVDADKGDYAAIAKDVVEDVGFERISLINTSDEELRSAAIEELDASEDDVFVVEDFVGDVIFVNGATWTVSVMGGEDFNGVTYVSIASNL